VNDIVQVPSYNLNGGFVHPEYIDQNLEKPEDNKKGITRRDWLAGLAMQGLLGTENTWTEETIANQSYMMADAVIAESRKETK